MIELHSLSPLSLNFFSYLQCSCISRVSRLLKKFAFWGIIKIKRSEIDLLSHFKVLCTGSVHASRPRSRLSNFCDLHFILSIRLRLEKKAPVLIERLIKMLLPCFHQLLISWLKLVTCTSFI
jgi:hypothetical protein